MRNGALEGRQVNLAPRALVYYRVRSDATRLLVVQHIVLRRRYDILGLDRRDNRRGHPRAEVGVLAAAIFEIATIERNARDVEPRPQATPWRPFFANSGAMVEAHVAASCIVEGRGDGEAAREGRGRAF